jgi:RNA polymerase sigma-70 factor (ECF subfamily)
LVERICAGDQSAFEEFYKRLSPLVHGIVLARVPRDEVDDIVQDVFISAYNSLRKLRDKNSVGPWIARIARNRAIEFYRRKKPTEELPENLAGRNSAKAEANEILDTLREMPDTYRETLILRLIEGMTGPEIAERTGLTHSSVRVNLHRGMRMLRSKLGIGE